MSKGDKERVVPIDAVFFIEWAAYLRSERPAGCPTPQCFVVLRGPTRGKPMTEAGLRKVFRTHRARSGATRVRPHRLRHPYGTELATAGIDLLALRELMGHAFPETTARYVHLSSDTLAAEFAARRPMSTAAATSTATDLLTAFIEHSELLGGLPDLRRQRLAAARAFLDAHPDLQVWMGTPVDMRIVELSRGPLACR